MKEVIMPIFGRKVYCPNCKQQLEQAPKRKAKCPHCNQYIYIREGKLVTEDDAQTLDWLRYLDRFGITRQKFDSFRKELSNKFKTQASVHDTDWYILNAWVASNPNIRRTKFAYYEMARLASQEGIDEKPYIEQALRSQLIFYKTRGVIFVWVENYEELPNYSTCPQCAELHGKRFSIDEALDKMPIPRSCTSESCRCTYEPDTRDIKLLSKLNSD